MKRQKKALDKDGQHEEAAKYGFCPTTYVLPGDYALFVEEFKRHPGQAWIMKPIGKAQGKGIFLFTKLSQISDWRTDYRWKPDNPSVESYVVQQYISNPYLVGGKKFDMRLYVLVTSFSPLVVYMYRSGFARFSHTRYSNAAGDVGNNFVHLTNVAIQKTADNYDDVAGGKWDLRSMKLHLICRMGIEKTNKLFADIEGIILRSLHSVQKIMINDKHCFELYGYDILFDDDLVPWLLEVNASPSLSANTPEDYDLKFKMLNDALDVVDIEQRTTGREERIGGYDLIWSNGPIRPERPSYYTTHLGCDFDKRLNVFRPRSKSGSGAPASKPATAGGSSGRGGAGGAGGRSGTARSPSTRRPASGRVSGKSGRPASGGDSRR